MDVCHAFGEGRVRPPGGEVAPLSDRWRGGSTRCPVPDSCLSWVLGLTFFGDHGKHPTAANTAKVIAPAIALPEVLMSPTATIVTMAIALRPPALPGGRGRRGQPHVSRIATSLPGT